MQDRAVIDVDGLQVLIDLLREDGWNVRGPVVRDGVIGQSEITSVEDLPRGVGDDQEAGRYRLRERDDEALFGFVVGPQSAKSVLFPANELLRRVRSGSQEPAPVEPPSDARPIAMLGVRSCDLHAIAIQDTVLLGRAAADAHYAARREGVLLIAVTCSDPGGTCFCVSMGTGPDPHEGFDLALTELLDDDGHRFVIRSGTDRGAAILDRLPTRAVEDADVDAAGRVVEHAVGRMGLQLDTEGMRDLLYANADHPQWDDVASRCLSCTNCTLVCPTCFCTSIEDSTELSTGTDERHRVWDSCFTSDFSYLHGGSVRSSTKSRYRQWATHKFAAWHDQFGSSGCVGCGRCVAWCPAAIDVTAELSAIRATSPPAPPTATED